MQRSNRRYSSGPAPRAALTLPFTMRQAALGLAALVMLVALILLVRGCAKRAAPDVTASGGPAASTQASAGDAAAAAPLVTPAPTPAPTEKVKLLQVVRRKKNVGKVVAITIDDCFQADNVRKIIKLAEKHGADLTFFPKGNEIKKNKGLWKEIYEKGYEIENHSYPHSDITKLSDDKLLKAIVNSERALNEALGVEYYMHYFRCPGGAGEKDPRLHKILRERGYIGVAGWGLSGTRKAEATLKLVQKGDIILFHSTKADLARLKVIIPELAKRGYKMVNLNDLYGKEPNLAVKPQPTEES